MTSSKMPTEFKKKNMKYILKFVKTNFEIFKKNFSNFIPDIKMYAQTINKYNFKIFLTILAWPQ